jgi:hypothetical protein
MDLEGVGNHYYWQRKHCYWQSIWQTLLLAEHFKQTFFVSFMEFSVMEFVGIDVMTGVDICQTVFTGRAF